jgi:hypothetical protein
MVQNSSVVRTLTIYAENTGSNPGSGRQFYFLFIKPERFLIFICVSISTKVLLIYSIVYLAMVSLFFIFIFNLHISSSSVVVCEPELDG